MIIDGWMMIKSENEGDINNNDIIPVKSMLHRHRLASLINNPALNQINDYQKNILVSLLGNFTSQEFEVFLQNYKLKIKQKLLTLPKITQTQNHIRVNTMNILKWNLQYFLNYHLVLLRRLMPKIL
uniref:Uncharacterized protein n=1 Tax=Meloidogyne incognita TaxID=6306 RepID=A0A914M1A2_MELIC